MLLAFITLLSSCQQQNDVGRYVQWENESKYQLLDTKTGILYEIGRKEGGFVWYEKVTPNY